MATVARADRPLASSLLIRVVDLSSFTSSHHSIARCCITFNDLTPYTRSDHCGPRDRDFGDWKWPDVDQIAGRDDHFRVTVSNSAISGVFSRSHPSCRKRGNATPAHRPRPAGARVGGVGG